MAVRVFYYWAILSLLLIHRPSHADANTEFDRASQLFRAGQYPQAIEAFQSAAQQGYNPAVVQFNLGVAYYRSGDYHRAENAFVNALSSPALAQLVQINLAILYQKQGQDEAARHWFRQAADYPPGPHHNRKLALLARQQLGEDRVNDNPFSFDAGISLASGHDNNVTAVATGSPSTESDNFTETYAYARFGIDWLQVKLAHFDQDFSRVNSSDFSQNEVAVLFPIRHGQWTVTPSWHTSQSQLDSTDYQDITDFRLSYEYRFSRDDRLRLRYRYSDIESRNTLYDYLSGSRYQLRMEYLSDTELGKWRLRYEFEDNDRQDLPTSNYSPQRHSLRLRLTNQLASWLKLKNELVYRRSLYEPIGAIQREDTRWQYLFDLYVLPHRTLELGLRYQYTDNESNIANGSESFTRSVSQVYLSWSF